MAQSTVHLNVHLTDARKVSVTRFVREQTEFFATIQVSDGSNSVTFMLKDMEDAKRLADQIVSAVQSIEEVQCQQ